MTAIDFDSDEFRREMINNGSAIVRRIVNDAGFGPFVNDGLVDMLIDAWFEGIKYGAGAVLATTPDMVSDVAHIALVEAFKQISNEFGGTDGS